MPGPSPPTGANTCHRELAAPAPRSNLDRSREYLLCPGNAVFDRPFGWSVGDRDFAALSSSRLLINRSARGKLLAVIPMVSASALITALMTVLLPGGCGPGRTASAVSPSGSPVPSVLGAVPRSDHVLVVVLRTRLTSKSSAARRLPPSPWLLTRGLTSLTPTVSGIPANPITLPCCRVLPTALPTTRAPRISEINPTCAPTA